MDQLKDILKQAIKYRFWIAVSISALLPIIAYVVGSGPVKEAAAKETKLIVDAKKDVDQFQAPGLPNRQWKPLVDENTAVVVKDVHASWTKLYDRQAPLMTWPEVVQERFREWGRAWPESEDASRVQLAIVDYVNAYPDYVTDVYSTFQPFDYDTGKGIVAAPTEALLLRPAKYDVSTPPDLGKVWANQERLWLQRTLLQVINDVNANAKDWRGAKIKQINLLEVGNAKAQDQVSLSKGEELEEAPAIVDPKAPPPPPEATSSAPMSTMPAGMGGMSTMGGGQNEKADTIFYLKNPSTQYKIMPVAISVLTEQDHIQDFLCALENSPIAIQVMEFEMSKPVARVEKPEMGGSNGNFAGYAGMMMGRGPMTGFGGGAAQAAMQRALNQMNAMPRGSAGAESGRAGGTGKSGTDVRTVDRKAKRTDIDEKASKTARHSVFDPYFNVVEVKVYAQARFYNPPPKLPTPEPTTAAAAPATETPAAEAPKTEGETPKTEGEAPKTETPKAETPKAESEDPKTDAPKTEGEAPKTDTPKPDDAAAPKTKAEAPKPAPEPGKPAK